MLHQVLARLSIELFEFRNCWVAATDPLREARADAVVISTADPAISSTPRAVKIVFRIFISVKVALGRGHYASLDAPGLRVRRELRFRTIIITPVFLSFSFALCSR